MEEELVSVTGKEFQIVGPRYRILNQYLQFYNNQVYTERLVEVQNGEPGYYLKRGYESYQAKDSSDRNT